MKIVWALHGFLGRTQDWDFLEEPLRKKNYILKTIDIYSSISGFDSWAKSFNQEVVSVGAEKNVLLGYSLGGRLALHSLLKSFSEDQVLWSKAVIVAAHFGLESLNQKKERLEKDLLWSKRFLSEDWDVLLKSWNEQKVFQSSRSSSLARRKESDFQRQKLSQTLDVWSLGRQQSLLQDLLSFDKLQKCSLLWVCGRQDERFCELYQQFQLQLNVWRKESKEIEAQQVMEFVELEAGHRVPWEASEEFIQTLVSRL